MVKTLLVNPPYSLEERYGRQMKSFGAVTEPLGLAYLAGSLLAHDLEVEILDAPALGYSPDDVIDRVRTGAYGLVGITFLTPMFRSVKQLARDLKRSVPGVKVVVGGPHPSALPERTLEEIPDIDFACTGEGEQPIVDLVHALDGRMSPEEIPGLVYRSGEDVRTNPPGPLERNLDALPEPARYLLPMDKYRLTASRTSKSSFCPTIIVARGCPFNCTYCSHLSGKTWRHHSVERILEELRALISRYSIEQVNFEADTLTLDKQFVSELCRSLIEEDLKIRWTCESRVDTLDEVTLGLMKQAGCWQISYGVETGSQRLLDLICKGTKKEQIREVFRQTRKVGIAARGFFMLGLPTETRPESLETIRFAKELDPFWAQFTLTIPYPGTPMFQELDARGEIRHHRWSDYNTWAGWADRELPYVPPERTQKELKALQKAALVEFYLRPAVLLRFLKSVRSFSDVAKYASGFATLLRSKLPH